MTYEEPVKSVSSCCYAPVRRKNVRDRTPIGGGSSRYIMTGVHEEVRCTDCKELCELTWPPCPLNICDGSGITIENAGYCGGCDTCGSREETEKPCPHTL